MIAAVQHDVQASQDYALLRSVGLGTARDGVRWNLVDRAGAYDFSSFTPMLKAALHNDVQVIWDLCHYGYPDDLDFFSAAFVDRLRATLKRWRVASPTTPTRFRSTRP